MPGSGHTTSRRPLRCSDGQSTVEWTGLVLLVCGAMVGLFSIGAIPPPAGVIHSIKKTILCAAAMGGGCPGGASVEHYGARMAALVRRYEPEIGFGRDLLGMPVDFRTCRSPACAEPGPGLGPVRSGAGEDLTLFTRVIDCRRGGVRTERCGGPAAGNVYLQYWAYFPESATFRGIPLLEEKGHHPHDWESTQVRIGPDGSVSQRASSHAGHNHGRSPGNWPSDAGIDLPSGMERALGRGSPGGWGRWTGQWLIEGGSHAGNVSDGRREARYPTVVPPGRARLVPLEAIREDPLFRPARFDPITPPWMKEVWSNPEAEGTG